MSESKNNKTYSSSDFTVGTNSKAGLLPKELADIMRENSKAMKQMKKKP